MDTEGSFIMYQTGQQVLYGIHGICNIVSIEPMRFGKVKANYYCLQPIAQPDARYYVPVENAAAVAKLRPLMSKEALLELLHSDAVRQDAWIPDENQRKQRYRELINSGDRAKLLSMIYCLHQHKKAQQSAGRKFHLCDENFLHDAERLLNSEFSQVFGLESGQVSGFIVREMGIGEE